VRTLAAAATGGALLLTAACGSTVATRSSAVSSPSGELDASATTDPGPVPSSATTGPAPVGDGPGTLPSTDGLGGPTGPGQRVTPGPGRGGRPAPVEVGFYVAKNAGGYYDSLGIKGVSVGDTVGMARAVVAEVNAHGGVAGHPVVPVFFAQDPTTTQTVSTIEQSACATWTQDHHVVAVVTPLNTGDTLANCLAAKGIPQISTSLTVLTAATLRRHPLLSSPDTAVEDEIAEAYVESLHRQGWFAPLSPVRPLKVGLLLFDVPDRQAVADRALVPALARRGVTLAERQAVRKPESNSDLGRTAAEVQSAVLRFNGSGVTHVLFLDQAGGLAFLFGLAAHNNRYFPRYGFTSNSAPLVLEQNLQPEDLRGSMGVGWLSHLDVTAERLPTPSRAEARCLRAMTRAQVDVTDQSVRELALAYCDGLLLLQAAVGRGPLTPAAYVSGLEELGSAFQPAASVATDFRQGRRAGASQARDLAYDESCRCFRYTGPPRSIR